MVDLDKREIVKEANEETSNEQKAEGLPEKTESHQEDLTNLDPYEMAVKKQKDEDYIRIMAVYKNLFTGLSWIKRSVPVAEGGKLGACQECAFRSRLMASEVNSKEMIFYCAFPGCSGYNELCGRIFTDRMDEINMERGGIIHGDPNQG